MTFRGELTQHTLLVVWHNGSFLFLDTLSHGGFKSKDNTCATEAVHGEGEAYCLVADNWVMVQSCLRHLLVEQRGWKEGVSSAEKQVGKSAAGWNAYQIELVYFVNKKEEHRWRQEGGLSSVPLKRGAKEVLTEVPAVESDDPFSYPNSSEIGPPGVRQAEDELTVLEQGGRVSVASRYAGAKSKAQRKGWEMAAEFKSMVKTLEISAPEAQLVYEAQIRKAEKRGALGEKAKAADLLQDANARRRRATGKVQRELAQEQEVRLGLERELERVNQLSQDSVSQYELVRAELTQAKTDGMRLAEALAEVGQDVAGGVKMHTGVPEDQAGCLDKGPEGSAKLAYEKERLAEQLVEAQVQAEKAERARIGLGEERDREVQLRRESENQARVLDEEVQRLQAELSRAKAQAGSPVSPVVAASTEAAEPTSAGTTTTSDILQHYSKLTAAMDRREKNLQPAAEAPHLISGTKQLRKEVAEVRRSQDKEKLRRQPSAAVPAQDPDIGDLPAALQGPSTLASETLVLIPLPVERVEQDDGASDDSDCRPIQPKLCRRARGKESGAGEVVVGFKRPKGEQKLTWDEFWEQEKGLVNEAFELHHKGEQSSVQSHIKCRYPGCHKRTKTLCSGCGVPFCSPRTTDEQCLEKHRLELLQNFLAERKERAYRRYNGDS